MDASSSPGFGAREFGIGIPKVGVGQLQLGRQPRVPARSLSPEAGIVEI